MKDNGPTIKQMEKVNCLMQMEIFISVTGPTAKLVVLGSTITRTERNTKVNGRTINGMGKDMKLGLMGIVIKVNTNRV